MIERDAVQLHGQWQDPKAGRVAVRGRGFTIIEIIVVIVLISVLSAFVVPRMISSGAREAELEAKQVRLLLTA